MKDKPLRKRNAKGTIITTNGKPRMSKSEKIVGLFIAAAISSGILYTIYNTDKDDNSSNTASWHGIYTPSNKINLPESVDSAHISTGAKGGLGSSAVSGGE